MKLLLLGTTGYHPNESRQTSCFMLPDIGVVLDAGTGMFRVREHLQTDTLDIFITHAHLDHIVGLTYLFDVLWKKNVQKVRVWGEAEKLAEIEKHLFAPAIFPVKPPFDLRPLGEQVALSDGGRVTHFPVVHPGGAVGFRIDWPDVSLAYVTDTTAAAGSDYVEKIRGVDLLLHECYFPDGWEDRAKLTGHSCITPVAQVAAEAGVGLLLLTHINPLLEEEDPFDLVKARQIFPAIEIGQDGTSVEF